MEFTQGHEKYAEKCLAMALSSEQDVDKALWLSLAQSWARLGDQVASVEHQSGGCAELVRRCGSPGSGRHTQGLV